MNGVQRAFGRHPVADTRDNRFSLGCGKFDLPERGHRYWQDHRWVGDQGTTPHCVGYAWAHWLHAAPFKQFLEPTGIYSLAQLLDEWQGTNYDGTSVRAGAKALSALGLIGRYEWADSVNQIAATILKRGPVVVGTQWTTGMSNPSEGGIIRPVGDALGGHAYLLTGVSLDRRVFRVKNSWGPTWGDHGRAWIRFEDFEALLDDHGEACIGSEREARP